MKRKLGWFGLGFAGAELAAACLPPLVCVPAAAFLALLAFWQRRRDTIIPMLGALCGLAWFLAFTLIWVRPAKALAGQTVTCTAIVETDADASYSESRLRGTLRLTEIDGKPANIRVQCSSFPGESAGERFTANFTLSELPDNQYRLSRNSKGVYLQAEYRGGYRALDASGAPRFALFCLRQRWSTILRRWLPKQLDGVEVAMLLADKSRLDDSVQQDFRTAGVSHLLAVSGLHLALLCGLLGFGRRWKFYRPLILLRGAAALFYILLTGTPVSVLRAGLVLFVALVGDFFLLPVDLLTSTGFAAILMGLQNAYAPCDIGFQLSFCAVLGVQAAAAATRAEQNWAVEKPRPVQWFCRLAEPVQTAALASLATLPVLVAHGMAASLAGLICNVLVVWMLQPALQMGILLLVLSALPFLLPLVNLTALILSLWLKLMLVIVEPVRRTAVRVGLSAAAVHAVCAGGTGHIGGCVLACESTALVRSGWRVLRGSRHWHGDLDAARRHGNSSCRLGEQPLRCLCAGWAGRRLFPGRREQPQCREPLSGRPCAAGHRQLLVDLRADPEALSFTARRGRHRAGIGKLCDSPGA